MFRPLTVVAAIDSSHECRRVLAGAEALLPTQQPASLFAIHVVPEASEALAHLLYPLACLGDDRDALSAELAQTARVLLRERYGDVLQPLDDHHLRVAHGPVAPTALELLKAIGPDLLVVGASSAEHPEPGVIGKDASRLARRAPCPVLVVRRRSGPPQLERILCAIDLTPDSAPLLASALSLAFDRKGHVDALHVIPSSAPLDHANLVETRGGKGLDPKASKEAARLFQQTATNLKLPFPIQSELPSLLGKPKLGTGDPGEEIIRTALEDQSDLIVIQRCVTRGGSGMRIGRVAEYVLRNAPCDVLVLPPPLGAPDAS